MAKVWIICAVVALAAGSALSVTADESVAGEWYGTYTGTGGERLEFFLTLKQDGEKVTGTYHNPGAGAQRRGITNPVSGTLKDGLLVFEKGLGGFKGTVTGNNMNGTFLAGTGATLNFTAKKTK
jgi:hypothetical protein